MRQAYIHRGLLKLEFHSDLKSKDNFDVLKKLKIEYIDPKFVDLEDLLKEGYELYKDNLIAFKYCDEKGNINVESNPNGSIENIHNVIGKSDIKKYDVNNTIGASSISDISGIPRATCVRKLEKLVKL